MPSFGGAGCKVWEVVCAASALEKEKQEQPGVSPPVGPELPGLGFGGGRSAVVGGKHP